MVGNARRVAAVAVKYSNVVVLFSSAGLRVQPGRVCVCVCVGEQQAACYYWHTHTHTPSRIIDALLPPSRPAAMVVVCHTSNHQSTEPTAYVSQM